MDENIYGMFKFPSDFALEVWFSIVYLILVLLSPDLSVFENTVDPNQLASDEAS